MVGPPGARTTCTAGPAGAETIWASPCSRGASGLRWRGGPGGARPLGLRGQAGETAGPGARCTRRHYQGRTQSPQPTAASTASSTGVSGSAKAPQCLGGGAPACSKQNPSRPPCRPTGGAKNGRRVGPQAPKLFTTLRAPVPLPQPPTHSAHRQGWKPPWVRWRRPASFHATCKPALF